MFKVARFSLSTVGRLTPKMPLRLLKPWSIARGVATAVNATSRGASRTFLGTAAGTTLLVLGGSFLAWPVADLCLGPRLVLLGMKAEPAQIANLLSSAAATSVSEETSSAQDACVVVISGVPGAGKQIEHIAAHSDRPVVYVSLREATSPHDLYFALVAGIYSADRLGFVGELAHSMGVWWITLFDIMVGCEPEKTRAINFSLVLQHLRRALRAAHAEQPLASPRPLVLFDNLGKATIREKDARMQSMLTHLWKWCVATCYDEGLADIVICHEPTDPLWRWSTTEGKVQRLHNIEAFEDGVVKRWSL